MTLLENLISNGTEITFSILFIAILIYVIKTNDEREKNYQNTIRENQQIISDTVKALNGYEDLKEEIAKISSRL